MASLSDGFEEDELVDDQPLQLKNQAAPALSGFRKRWAQRLAGDANEQSPLEAFPLEQDLEGTDVKRICIESRAVSRDTARMILRKPAFKMPWQQGPLAPLFTGRLLLGTRSEPLAMPRVGLQDVLTGPPKDEMDHATSGSKASVRFGAMVAKRIAAARFNVPEDELRIRALNMFKLLICMDLSATVVGCNLSDLAGRLDPAIDISKNLADVFANKATGTLLKRGGSMTRFCQWMMDTKDQPGFRATEKQVYEYVDFLRDEGAAPTAASHFVEALRFCHSTLQFTGMDVNKVLSTRVLGASHRLFLGKRMLQQAPAFTVEAVRTFEKLCLHADDYHKRVICGAILFCIFACARWFDISYVTGIKFDEFVTMSILEASTARHKTSRTKEQKTRLLPLTSTGRFLEKESWAASFIRARNAMEMDKLRYFMPSWNEIAGSWADHPMTSAEVSCWIHELLAEEIGIQSAARFSSHSCKATLLTWAAMTTLFNREERTLLGHHVEAQTRSNTTYSRDCQILLQYKVVKLINLIKNGHLLPDATRAERLARMLDADRPAHPDVSDQVAEPAATDSSEDESEDCSDPGVEQLAPQREPQLRQPLVGDIPGASWFQHSFTGVLHIQMDDSDERLACGRQITVNARTVPWDQVNTDDALMRIRCHSAYKKREAAYQTEEVG